MVKAAVLRKLIRASIALVILLYFMFGTASPKVVFIPFLICCTASIGKNLALLFEQTKIALVLDRVFKVVFFLSWFAFLAAACCAAVRDGNYKLLLFTLPLWLGGLFFLKRKLPDKKR